MSVQDDYEELLGRLDEPEPEPWQPENHGDTIAGQITAFDSITSKYGTTPAIILDGPMGLVRVLAGHAVLKRELTVKRDLQIGDRVAIRYLGEAQGKNGRFTDYKVACKPERFRQPAAPKAEAAADDPWGWDDNGVPFPSEQLSGEPPF